MRIPSTQGSYRHSNNKIESELSTNPYIKDYIIFKSLYEVKGKLEATINLSIEMYGYFHAIHRKSNFISSMDISLAYIFWFIEFHGSFSFSCVAFSDLLGIKGQHLFQQGFQIRQYNLQNYLLNTFTINPINPLPQGGW